LFSLSGVRILIFNITISVVLYLFALLKPFVFTYSLCRKSSVINTLISKKSCKVAPVPGETKIWQYITLFKRISLIDCPGVVVDTAGDTETDSVLKGVVRAERLENPEDYIDAIQSKVRREHIAAQYNIPKDGDQTWHNSTELLEMIAKKSGRLLKGGEPCIRSAAITLINDFQRGRLPHYVSPPELKEGEGEPAQASAEAGEAVQQDLDAIGEENMEKDEMEDDEAEDSADTEEDRKIEAGNSSTANKVKENSVQDSSSVSDEEEEQEAPSNSLIGSGDWED
jgi:nuclear GTP-binding protein